MSKSREVIEELSRWPAYVILKAEQTIALERIATALEKLTQISEVTRIAAESRDRNYFRGR